MLGRAGQPKPHARGADRHFPATPPPAPGSHPQPHPGHHTHPHRRSHVGARGVGKGNLVEGHQAGACLGRQALVRHVVDEGGAVDQRKHAAHGGLALGHVGELQQRRACGWGGGVGGGVGERGGQGCGGGRWGYGLTPLQEQGRGAGGGGQEGRQHRCACERAGAPPLLPERSECSQPPCPGGCSPLGPARPPRPAAQPPTARKHPPGSGPATGQWQP